MIGLLIKAVLGAFLFTFILWLAQSRNPRVAGMMLTFPALNGIGLLTGERQDVSVMAHAMAPMIVTNGLLCAGYVLVYSHLRRVGVVAQRVQAVGLMVLCLLLWGVAASLLAAPVESWLMMSGSIGMALLGYGLLAGPLMWGLWRPAQEQSLLRRSWWQVVRANVERVAGLVGLLVLVMVCVRFGANTWAGRLSALPLLPLYALAMMASNAVSAPALQQLGSTVLMGPVVAIGFVWGFWRYLDMLGQNAGEVMYVGGGVVGLLVGWGICGGVIWGVVRVASAVEDRIHEGREGARRREEHE